MPFLGFKYAKIDFAARNEPYTLDVVYSTHSSFVTMNKQAAVTHWAATI